MSAVYGMLIHPNGMSLEKHYRSHSPIRIIGSDRSQCVMNGRCLIKNDRMLAGKDRNLYSYALFSLSLPILFEDHRLQDFDTSNFINHFNSREKSERLWQSANNNRD